MEGCCGKASVVWWREDDDVIKIGSNLYSWVGLHRPFPLTVIRNQSHGPSSRQPTRDYSRDIDEPEYSFRWFHGRGWLLNAARTCKALYEPALTALYRSPLLQTVLSSRPTSAAAPAPGGLGQHAIQFNYRNKVQRLEILLAGWKSELKFI
ncbi:MAG: hypothetical protein M1823_001234 [Watsoniomyces obsoletus]|nr:MAG: hypothetical protein M1823_001234 [Watsoniomyces obsoletus]